MVEVLLERRVLPAWGDRAVAELTRGDLLKLLEDVRQPRQTEVVTKARGTFTAARGGTGAAVEVRKLVRAKFQYAVEGGLRPDNPFDGVRNRDKSQSCDRVLAMDEVRAVWQAAGAMPYPWGPWYRLRRTDDRRGE